MKKLLLVIIVALISTLSFGQYTTVTGTAVRDKNGNLANGTIELKSNQEYGFTTSSAACCLSAIPLRATVTNGAFTLTNVPNHGSIKPSTQCFTATITDVNGNVVLGPDGYRCLQPNGTTWSFDTFQLSATNVATDGGTAVPYKSVLALPPHPNIGQRVRAIDCESNIACSVGGGSTKLDLSWNGTSWEIVSSNFALSPTGVANDVPCVVGTQLGACDSTHFYYSGSTLHVPSIIANSLKLVPGQPADTTVTAIGDKVHWNSTSFTKGTTGYLVFTVTALDTNTGQCQADTATYPKCVYGNWSVGVAAFDGTSVANDIFLAGPTNGQFADAGTSDPNSVTSGRQIVGVVMSANSGAGTTSPVLFWTSSLTTTPGLTITTSTPVTVNTSGYSGFYYNQHATAATAVSYNLPTAAAGKQFCFANSYNGSAANTGVLTINTSASGQFIIDKDGSIGSSGGHITSGGSAGDSGCVVGVDSTHWQWYIGQGTWTKN